MTATSTARNRTAIGIRCHSGWAAVIVAHGNRLKIEILERRRIELCDPKIEGSKQPFHFAEPMAFADAQGFIARCRSSTDGLARKAFAGLAPDGVAGCAVLCASARKLPPLKGILASHALIHAAEGEFYRDAVCRAAERAGIPVVRIREKDVLVQASDCTRLQEAMLAERLASLGKRVGPPWTTDQKLATLAAWCVLAVN